MGEKKWGSEARKKLAERGDPPLKTGACTEKVCVHKPKMAIITNKRKHSDIVGGVRKKSRASTKKEGRGEGKKGATKKAKNQKRLRTIVAWGVKTLSTKCQGGKRANQGRPARKTVQFLEKNTIHYHWTQPTGGQQST